MDLTPEALLKQGIAALLLSLDESQQAKLLRHVELLRLWNKTFNLLGRDDIKTILIYDVLDSLALYPFIENSPILDMGSGAGFPGIPLAIALPQYHFTLLEANGKKASFLRQAVLDLKLTHVSVLHNRAEHIQERFHVVLARAFAPLPELAAMAMPLLHKNGVLLAMQGKKVNAPLPSDQIRHLNVPFLAEKRTLVIRSRQ